MLKTAHDAEEFMRTGARASPSWPGGDTPRPDTLKQTDQPPDLDKTPCRRGGPYVFNNIDLLGNRQPAHDAKHCGVGVRARQDAVDVSRPRRIEFAATLCCRSLAPGR